MNDNNIMAVASLVDSTSVEPFLEEAQTIAGKFLHVYLDQKDVKVVPMSPQLPTVKEAPPKDDVAMEVSAVCESIVCVCECEREREVCESASFPVLFGTHAWSAPRRT